MNCFYKGINTGACTKKKDLSKCVFWKVPFCVMMGDYGQIQRVKIRSYSLSDITGWFAKWLLIAVIFVALGYAWRMYQTKDLPVMFCQKKIMESTERNVAIGDLRIENTGRKYTWNGYEIYELWVKQSTEYLVRSK